MEFQGKTVQKMIANVYSFEIWFTDGSYICVQGKDSLFSGLEYVKELKK